MFAWDYEHVFNYEMCIKRDSSSIASKRVYPIGIMCMWQAKQEKENRGNIHDWYKGSNICEGLFRSMMGFKVTSKDFVNEMWYAYA